MPALRYQLSHPRKTSQRKQEKVVKWEPVRFLKKILSAKVDHILVLIRLKNNVGSHNNPVLARQMEMSAGAWSAHLHLVDLAHLVPVWKSILFTIKSG
ncbi:MAG: hypothetical protein V2G48_07925 [bacterium JZ-2024 1]